MTDDVLRGFERFAVAVRDRLEKGAEAYSDRPAATRPMGDLASEIRDELADVAGWSACLWVRLESLRERLSVLEPTAEPLRMVGAERTGR